MTVYIVFYYDESAEMWLVGNAYYNQKEAVEEAEKYNGYVISRYVC